MATEPGAADDPRSDAAPQDSAATDVSNALHQQLSLAEQDIRQQLRELKLRLKKAESMLQTVTAVKAAISLHPDAFIRTAPKSSSSTTSSAPTEQS